MEDIKMAFAKNIQELRKARGLTQTELAEILNYSDKAVSKWERGESIPDVVTTKQIADFFGVTVDYMLKSEHTEKPDISISPRVKKNRFIITMLATMLVWLIATVVFVCLASTSLVSVSWMTFVYALPVCLIVVLVFNSIWGNRKYNFAIISGLVWSFLASMFLSFMGTAQNLWLIFVIGIPAEIIIILWSKLKIKD